MRSIIALWAFLGFSALAHGADYIGQYVPEARTVGTHRVKMAIWDVYDVTLYAQSGTYVAEKPFALSLTYLKSIPGRIIADQATSVMRRQGFKNEYKLAQWHERMTKIFPDVEPGTTLTGITNGKGNVVFLNDGKPIGKINDKEFEKHFFGIWLNPQAEEPELRKNLLGG